MIKKTTFLILLLSILNLPTVFAEEESDVLHSSSYPGFLYGIGSTFDFSIQGYDELFIHGLFVYSPFRTDSFVLSLRLFVLANPHDCQLRIPVTGTLRLFHFDWGEVSPFLGLGGGYFFVTYPGPFLFLHSGLDVYIQPSIMLSIGANLLFVGDNFMDLDVFFTFAIATNRLFPGKSELKG